MNLRQKELLNLLSHQGEMSIGVLAKQLNVSEMTIHRDADYLEEQHYLYKKRGALVYIEDNDRNRADFYFDEKRSIGIKAASLIFEGQSIIFDNSTTALECARFLDPSKKFVLYATGMETASILAKYENSILYCSGGYYFHPSKGFVGSQAEAFVTSVKADICIIGASGVSIEDGITAPYPPHTSLERAIIAASKKKILVCDHSKFGKSAMEKICELSDIDMIVTDGAVTDDVYEKYSKYIKIIKA